MLILVSALYKILGHTAVATGISTAMAASAGRLTPEFAAMAAGDAVVASALFEGCLAYLEGDKRGKYDLYEATGATGVATLAAVFVPALHFLK